MKILWLCNIMLPVVAKHLHREANNKEGWLTGLSAAILERQHENETELGIAFPVHKELAGFCEVLQVGRGNLACYGFVENTARAEIYDMQIEAQLIKILEDFQPDMVHCFGTEYPHTLAMTRAFARPEKTLIGIQGLCAVYAKAYMADLPHRIQDRVTFRDWLKKDSLAKQQQKFVKRGEYEIEAIQNTGHVTGRTPWDKRYTFAWNPKAEYHFMNETLRSNFYEGKWDRRECEPYSIFLSQGDYPIKGLHYVLLAMPAILRQYPDTKVYVAGSNIVKQDSLKEKLKLSAYGKYLWELMKQNNLEEKIVFLGRLIAEEMKKQYLKSHLFLCPSSIENSPNSLGEAMILGMPVVTADVGGIRGIFEAGKDGIMYEGFRGDELPEQEKQQADRLAEAVCSMWSEEKKQAEYCKNAREHAGKTHDREQNYLRLMEIYREIVL